MNRTIALTILTIFLASIIFNTDAVCYSMCYNAASMSYLNEPINTGYCGTVLSAASKCSRDVNCVMFSKNGTQCSFFRRGNNSMICEREISDDIVTSYFRIGDCKFESGPWTMVGSLYLHVTTEMYTCDQGQAVCSSLGGTMAEFHNTSEMDNAYKFITGSVFVGIDYISGQYVWRTTGLEVSADFWAPDQPLGDPCVQLWITEYGLDDTSLSRYKKVLCEKRIS